MQNKPQLKPQSALDIKKRVDTYLAGKSLVMWNALRRFHLVEGEICTLISNF